MWFLLLRELFEVCQVFPAWLNWREGRIVCEEKEGGVEEGNALECLSTSALLPSAETGTLWEQACSGVFHAPCMEGELRGRTMHAKWTKASTSTDLFTKGQKDLKRSLYPALHISGPGIQILRNRKCFVLALTVVSLDKQGLIYNRSHTYLTISHLICQSFLDLL